jgi:putative transposase
MPYNPDRPQRSSLRLKGYDYTQPGAYFVTICTKNRECLLGEIVGGVVQLNEYGRIVAETWQWLERQYAYVELDA